jgi:hypothetical protein
MPLAFATSSSAARKTSGLGVLGSRRKILGDDFIAVEIDGRVERREGGGHDFVSFKGARQSGMVILQTATKLCDQPWNRLM